MDLIDYQSDVNAILSVLVLYKTRLEDSKTFISFGNSLKARNLRMDIAVYDNSPTPMAADAECITEPWTIHYLHDKTNPGVSKAYNKGLEIARKLNKKWLLLLDQDTSFPQNAVVEYIKAVQKNPDIHLFAPIVRSRNKIISPCIYFLNKGFALHRVKAGVSHFKRRSLINSGILISAEAYEKAGGYNEKIRLDFADHFFIEKYKAVYNRFAVIDLKCLQDFSSDQQLTMSSALIRFSFYCEGARNKAVNKLDYFELMLATILRGTKLSLKYMNFRFFRIVKDVFWS